MKKITSVTMSIALSLFTGIALANSYSVTVTPGDGGGTVTTGNGNTASYSVTNGENGSTTLTTEKGKTITKTPNTGENQNGTYTYTTGAGNTASGYREPNGDKVIIVNSEEAARITYQNGGGISSVTTSNGKTATVSGNTITTGSGKTATIQQGTTSNGPKSGFTITGSSGGSISRTYLPGGAVNFTVTTPTSTSVAHLAKEKISAK